MAPSMAAVLQAPRKLFLYVLLVFLLFYILDQVKSSQVELYCHSTTCVDI